MDFRLPARNACLQCVDTPSTNGLRLPWGYFNGAVWSGPWCSEICFSGEIRIVRSKEKREGQLGENQLLHFQTTESAGSGEESDSERGRKVPDYVTIAALNQIPGGPSLLYRPYKIVEGLAGHGCHQEEHSTR